MSRHKVKRYDGEDGSDVTADAPDAMEQANQTENLDTTPGPRAMPSRPVTPTPVAAPRKAAARSNENYGNEGRRSAPPAKKLTQETMADRAESYVAKRAAARAADNAAAASKASTDAETARLAQRNMPASKFNASQVNPKTLLPAKGYAKGGAVGSFRSSADGIAQRGKTRGQQFCNGGMAKGKK